MVWLCLLLKDRKRGVGRKERGAGLEPEAAGGGEGKLEIGPKRPAGWAGRAPGQNQPQTEGKVLSPAAL